MYHKRCALVTLIVVAMLAGGCNDKTVSTPQTTDATPSATTSEVDPYEIYLANNPDPSLVLSREDAQTRAFLGCGTNFAPGTVDAALADAYRPTGICE